MQKHVRAKSRAERRRDRHSYALRKILAAPHSNLAMLLLMLVAAGSASAGVMHTCYVDIDATGTNNGKLWVNAYTNLQTALTNSTCAEVWVAEGVYLPTTTSRASSFNIHPGVKVYGGFDPDTGTDSFIERDPLANVTTLSGDIGTLGSTSDNSYHVVLMDGTTALGPILDDTVLDGFTITGGTANRALYPDDKGAGLYCDGFGSGHVCSPTLSNIIFRDNHADSTGGGMYNNGAGGISSPVLSMVSFIDNSATNGGAMFNQGGAEGVSSPILTDVVFRDNSADYLGGALLNGGGGGTSNPVLKRVTFSGNGAPYGGAVYNNGASGLSTPTLINVTFSGNSADLYGGAMYSFASNNGTSSPVLENVSFSGNSAYQGGAMFSYDASGGTSNATLTNVILWDNTASGAGAQIYNNGATTDIDFSIIEGGCPTGSTCTNPVSGDPQLGPLADNGGFTHTMLPAYGGSAIDSGTCVGAPGIDQRGIARPAGAGCDVGAVEFLLPSDDVIFSDGFDAGPF